MKKILSLILSLCLLCAGAAALAEGESPAGTWYLTSAEYQGTTIPIDGTGLSMTFILNEDGTCSLSETAGGVSNSTEGTWVATDAGVAITADGETMDFRITDGVMFMEMDGGTLHLTRNAPEAAALTEAAVRPAESLAEFDGSWTVSKMNMMGFTLTADEITPENQAVLRIQNGHIVETAASGTETVMDGTLVDGKLAGSLESLTFEFALLEDGNLQAILTTEVEGQPVEAQFLYAPFAE